MNDLFEKLKASIIAGRTLHAYLMTGTDPDLTDSMARSAASYILYGEDRADQLANEPDYMEYSGSISIGDFRENIRPEIYRETYRRKGRAVVLRSANLLSPIVQNAMLKVLEEPPENTYFILTGNEYGILPTIRSRCMIIRCSSRDTCEIERLLRERGASAAEAKRFALISGGVTGRAIRLYEEPEFRELREGVVGAMLSALDSAPDYKWSKVKRDRLDHLEANEMLLLACHDMLCWAAGTEPEFCPDIADRIKKTSSRFTIGEIGCIISKITQNAQRLATNAPGGMAFDRLFTELAEISLNKRA